MGSSRSIRPADAVAGEEAHQGVGLDGSPRSPLVTLRGGHAGPPVDEGDELARLGQDHVVSSGAVDGDQSQVRLGPIDPVAALGVAGGLPLEERTPVVHAVDVAVLEDGGVKGRVVFHGIVEADGHPAGQRRAQAKAGSHEPVDEQMIHEQLASRADVDDVAGQGRGQRQEGGQYQDRGVMDESHDDVPPESMSGLPAPQQWAFCSNRNL